MIDILSKINNNDLNGERAEEVLDKTLDKFHADELEHAPQKELCLNKYEWTAISFGIDLIVLAQWRKEGWPTKCKNCGKKIDYKKFGWKIKENHLTCICCNR